MRGWVIVTNACTMDERFVNPYALVYELSTQIPKKT